MDGLDNTPIYGWFTMKIIVLLAVLMLVSYIYGYNRSQTEYIFQTENNTVIETITSYTQCNDYRIVNVSQIQPIPHDIYITYNMTDTQIKQLKNAHIPCNTVGCSEGAVRMKYKIFEIFGLTPPKFSERPPTHENLKINDTPCLPVQTDGFGQYIHLDNEMWHIWRGFEILNKTQITTGNYSDDSLWTQAKGKDIYLRLA
jgi:hypothetical protein